MRRTGLLVVCIVMFTALCAVPSDAQRKAVSAAEVTGTFRYNFTGKFRGYKSEIKIAALGKGKLRISFDISDPYMLGDEATAHEGTGEGEATIEGDTAVYTEGGCTITFKFVRPGIIKARQKSTPEDCGFGRNVYADATYKKISGKTPNFDVQ